MFRTSFATMILILFPFALVAEEMSFGGIEVGKTGCAEARDLLDAAGAIAASDASAITLGPMYHLRSGAMGVGFVRSGTVLCDEAGARIAAIELIIDKNASDTVANLIARRHQVKSRRLPSLGEGHAAFVSASGESSARIDYVHLSFDATVLMGTRWFDSQFSTWQESQRQQKSQALEDAF